MLNRTVELTEMDKTIMLCDIFIVKQPDILKSLDLSFDDSGVASL